MREEAEVQRAKLARKKCEAEHGPAHEEFVRVVRRGEVERASRAGLTQAKISRIEGADTVPTLPLLRRLAKAMDATLNIALDEDEASVAFEAHRSDAA